MSGLIFGLWYTVAWFVWGYLSTTYFNSKLNDINFSNNRYTLALIASVFWFLFTLVFQKKSLNRALVSTAIFFIFYIVGEIAFTILNTL